MTKQQHLFYLIKSLSKSEKRHFKLFMAGNNENNNYLLLFNAMANQDVYNEKQIKNQFKDKDFIKQLHVTKNYLMRMILKSLRNYHRTISKDAELHDMLRDIEILFKRDLVAPALIILEKSIKMATKYEKWSELLTLLDMKKRHLLNYKGTMEAGPQITGIIKQEKNILQKLNHISDYWDLTITLFERLNAGENLANNSLLIDDQQADSLQAKTFYHYIWQAILSTGNHHKEVKRHLEESIFLWEENAHHIEENPASYLTMLNNLAGYSLGRKDFEYAQQVLLKIRRVPERYGLKRFNRIAARAMAHSYNIELELYRDTDNLQKVPILAERIMNFIKENDANIPDSYTILLLYQMAHLHYRRNELSKALDLLNQIIAFNFGAIREDIQAYANLMFLIIHFELENFILLRYAVESCRRFLKKKRHLHNFEKVLLKGFSVLSIAPKRDFANCFQKLKGEVFTGLNKRQKMDILDYFDFEDWIEQNLLKFKGK